MKKNFERFILFYRKNIKKNKKEFENIIKMEIELFLKNAKTKKKIDIKII